MTATSAISDRLRPGALLLPPLAVRRVLRRPRTDGRTAVSKGAMIDATWQKARFKFAVEWGLSSSPKSIVELVERARRSSSAAGALPLIMVPYLSAERIAELEERQTSGIDLCGNGILIAPSKLLVVRSGQPNRFREPRPIRNVYRGDTSLVARVFLTRPGYATVSEVWAEVRARGGFIALSTVSKALKVLEEDLTIARDGNGIRLVQAEKLLESLAANYRAPQPTARFLGRSPLPEAELLSRLASAATQGGVRLVMTGGASVNRYAVMAREPVLSLYCVDSPDTVLATAGILAQKSNHFANLELIQTDDVNVYFDPRIREAGPFCSPIQTWLELFTGEERERDTAAQVKKLILNELNFAPRDTSDER